MMANDKDKLKQIETELKKKAIVLEQKEKELNLKMTAVENTELFIKLASLVDEAFSTYETTLGDGEGCKEMIINLVDAKLATQIAVWDK